MAAHFWKKYLPRICSKEQPTCLASQQQPSTFGAPQHSFPCGKMPTTFTILKYLLTRKKARWSRSPRTNNSFPLDTALKGPHKKQEISFPHHTSQPFHQFPISGQRSLSKSSSEVTSQLWDPTASDIFPVEKPVHSTHITHTQEVIVHSAQGKVNEILASPQMIKIATFLGNNNTEGFLLLFLQQCALSFTLMIIRTEHGTAQDTHQHHHLTNIWHQHSYGQQTNTAGDVTYKVCHLD